MKPGSMKNIITRIDKSCPAKEGAASLPCLDESRAFEAPA
jgi:hypothetical protein